VGVIVGVRVIVGVGVIVGVAVRVRVGVGSRVIVDVSDDSELFCPDSTSEVEFSPAVHEVANNKIIVNINKFLFFILIPNYRITAPIIPKHKPFSLNMYCMI
jgi:hypothetical protein